jgi:hypothetical protein
MQQLKVTVMRQVAHLHVCASAMLQQSCNRAATEVIVMRQVAHLHVCASAMLQQSCNRAATEVIVMRHLHFIDHL